MRRQIKIIKYNNPTYSLQEERSSSGYGFEKVPKNNPFPREGKSRGNSRSVSKGWSLIKRTLFTPMGNNEGNGPKKNVRGKKHEDMNVETYDGKLQSVSDFFQLKV